MCTNAFILSFYVNFQMDMLYNIFKHSLFRRRPVPSSFFSSVFYTQRFNSTQFELLWIWKRHDVIWYTFTSIHWYRLFRFFYAFEFPFDYLLETLRLSIRNFRITCNFNNHLEQYSNITITILAVLFLTWFFSLRLWILFWNYWNFMELVFVKKRIKKFSNNKNKTSKNSHLWSILSICDSCWTDGSSLFLVLEIFFFVAVCLPITFSLFHTHTNCHCD